MARPRVTIRCCNSGGGSIALDPSKLLARDSTEPAASEHDVSDLALDVLAESTAAGMRGQIEAVKGSVDLSNPGYMSIDITNGANPIGFGCIQMGSDAFAYGNRSIAIGRLAVAHSAEGSVIPGGATASVAIGESASARYPASIALGPKCQALRVGGTAVGYLSTAWAGGVAVGYGVKSGNESQGVTPTLGSVPTTSLGTTVANEKVGSIAIGSVIEVLHDRAAVIGSGSIGTNPRLGSTSSHRMTMYYNDLELRRNPDSPTVQTGVILTDENGGQWRITVNSSGTLSAAAM